MGDQYIYQQGDKQNNSPAPAETQSNQFLEYQMLGYRASNAPQENSSYPPAPYYDRNYRPTAPQSLIDNNGMPVQGGDIGSYPPAPYYDRNYRPAAPQSLIDQNGMPVQGGDIGYRQAMQVAIDPQRLAVETEYGHFSHNLYTACEQIWQNTKNPQAVNQLLRDINGDLQGLGSPYRFGSNFQPVPPGQGPGTQPVMSIIMEDLRDKQHNNQVFLR